MTGIDDSTLNYWMREGVLRPTEGGEGRGNHRRFDYREVTLAALLFELHSFGIGTASLALISKQFHEALDWMTSNGISHANLYAIMDLLQIQWDIVRQGCVPIYLLEEDEEWFANHEIHRQGHTVWVEANWDEAFEYMFRPRPHRNPTSLPTPSEVAMVRSWKTESDLARFRRMEMFWAALDEIQFTLPESSDGDGTLYFRKDIQGEWSISDRPRGKEAEHPISFIGVDVPLLSYRLWQPWAEASGSALAVRSRSWGKQS